MVVTNTQRLGDPLQGTGTGQVRLSGRTIKRSGLIAGALAITVTASSYGHDWWTNGRFLVSTDDAYVGGDITVIASQVSGFIATLRVTDNQPVTAGQVLMTIDDRPYRAALAKADASVATANATIANINASRQLQKSLIDQAQAQLIVTDAQRTLTRNDIVRYRSLTQDQWTSTQRLQQAEASFQAAVGADAEAKSALEASRRRLDVIDTERQQAEAALASAVADRDAARLNVEYTVLRAPVDGVVGDRGARRGAFTAIGAQLLSVVPAHGLWVDANFKENQLAHMRPGQSVTVRADVLPGELFRGRVESVAPATGAVFSVLPAENATGNFTKIVQRVPVRVRLDRADAEFGRLRPGFSVTASVDERDPGPTRP